VSVARRFERLVRQSHRFVKRQHIFWIGLFLYVVSFFLPSIAGPVVRSGPARGYHCAFFSLLLPLDPNSFARDQVLFKGGLVEHLSLFISGCINPVFLSAAALGFSGRRQLSMAVLRILVILMMPFCWIVFHYESLYPREGYFVWIIGMLLVLFSRELSGGGDRIRAMNSAADAPR
jgi:hypothetical protein